jgi:hypothetical protein
MTKAKSRRRSLHERITFFTQSLLHTFGRWGLPGVGVGANAFDHGNHSTTLGRNSDARADEEKTTRN